MNLHDRSLSSPHIANGPRKCPQDRGERPHGENACIDCRASSLRVRRRPWNALLGGLSLGPRPPRLLATYLGNNLGFAAHYALLGQTTAVTMNLVLGVQTLVALGFARWPRLRWTYYALIPVLLVAAVMTWQGWLSLLSTTATAFSTVARMQANEFALRVLMLASAPLWATHDLLAGSLPGLLADLSCIATGVWMLLKHAPAN